MYKSYLKFKSKRATGIFILLITFLLCIFGAIFFAFNNKPQSAFAKVLTVPTLKSSLPSGSYAEGTDVLNITYTGNDIKLTDYINSVSGRNETENSGYYGYYFEVIDRGANTVIYNESLNRDSYCTEKEVTFFGIGVVYKYINDAVWNNTGNYEETKPHTFLSDIKIKDCTYDGNGQLSYYEVRVMLRRTPKDATVNVGDAGDSWDGGAQPVFRVYVRPKEITPPAVSTLDLAEGETFFSNSGNQYSATAVTPEITSAAQGKLKNACFTGTYAADKNAVEFYVDSNYTNAGTHTPVLALKDATGSTADKARNYTVAGTTYNFEIAKRELVSPYFSDLSKATNLSYKPAGQTVTFNANNTLESTANLVNGWAWLAKTNQAGWANVVIIAEGSTNGTWGQGTNNNDTLTLPNAGNYTLTFELNDKANYKWVLPDDYDYATTKTKYPIAIGLTDDKITIEITVKPLELIVPYLTEIEYAYAPNIELEFENANESYSWTKLEQINTSTGQHSYVNFKLSGVRADNETAIDNLSWDGGIYHTNGAGIYKVEFKLVDAINYAWKLPTSYAAGTTEAAKDAISIVASTGTATVSGIKINQKELKVPYLTSPSETYRYAESDTSIPFNSNNGDSYHWSWLAKQQGTLQSFENVAITSSGRTLDSADGSAATLSGSWPFGYGNLSVTAAGIYTVTFTLIDNYNIKWVLPDGYENPSANYPYAITVSGAANGIATVSGIRVEKKELTQPTLSGSKVYSFNTDITFDTNTDWSIISSNANGYYNVPVTSSGVRPDSGPAISSSESQWIYESHTFKPLGAGTYSVSFALHPNIKNNYKWAGTDNDTVTVSDIVVNKKSIYVPYLSSKSISKLSGLRYTEEDQKIELAAKNATSDFDGAGVDGWTWLNSNVTVTAPGVAFVGDAAINSATWDSSANTVTLKAAGTYSISFKFVNKYDYSWVLPAGYDFATDKTDYPLEIEVSGDTAKIKALVLNKKQITSPTLTTTTYTYGLPVKFAANDDWAWIESSANGYSNVAITYPGTRHDGTTAIASNLSTWDTSNHAFVPYGAGKYTITFTLNGNVVNNYEWTVPDSAGASTVTIKNVVINKKAVYVPYFETPSALSSLAYNPDGSPVKFVANNTTAGNGIDGWNWLDNTSNVTITSSGTRHVGTSVVGTWLNDTLTLTDAGTYSVSFRLRDTYNYEWALPDDYYSSGSTVDTTKYPLAIAFDDTVNSDNNPTPHTATISDIVVSKATITKPTLTEKTYTYEPNLAITFDANTHWDWISQISNGAYTNVNIGITSTASAEIPATWDVDKLKVNYAGTFTVTFTLNASGINNYQWSALDDENQPSIITISNIVVNKQEVVTPYFNNISNLGSLVYSASGVDLAFDAKNEKGIDGWTWLDLNTAVTVTGTTLNNSAAISGVWASHSVKLSNAGAYTISISLNEPRNYKLVVPADYLSGSEWDSAKYPLAITISDDAVASINVTVNRVELYAPYITQLTYTYSSSLTISYSNNNLSEYGWSWIESITGGNRNVNIVSSGKRLDNTTEIHDSDSSFTGGSFRPLGAGTYTLSFILIDQVNYKWVSPNWPSETAQGVKDALQVTEGTVTSTGITVEKCVITLDRSIQTRYVYTDGVSVVFKNGDSWSLINDTNIVDVVYSGKKIGATENMPDNLNEWRRSNHTFYPAGAGVYTISFTLHDDTVKHNYAWSDPDTGDESKVTISDITIAKKQLTTPYLATPSATYVYTKDASGTTISFVTNNDDYAWTWFAQTSAGGGFVNVGISSVGTAHDGTKTLVGDWPANNGNLKLTAAGVYSVSFTLINNTDNYEWILPEGYDFNTTKPNYPFEIAIGGTNNDTVTISGITVKKKQLTVPYISDINKITNEFTNADILLEFTAPDSGYGWTWLAEKNASSAYSNVGITISGTALESNVSVAPATIGKDGKLVLWDAGKYVIEFNLFDRYNYVWILPSDYLVFGERDSTKYPIEITLSESGYVATIGTASSCINVTKKTIAVPTWDNAEHVYSKTDPVTFTIPSGESWLWNWVLTTVSGNYSDGVTVSNATFSNSTGKLTTNGAGTYSLKFKLTESGKYINNYKWSAGGSESEYTISDITVKKLSVVAPNIDTNNEKYIYNDNPTVNFVCGTTTEEFDIRKFDARVTAVTLNGATITGVNYNTNGQLVTNGAGKYTIEFTLTTALARNYQWVMPDDYLVSGERDITNYPFEIGVAGNTAKIVDIVVEKKAIAPIADSTVTKSVMYNPSGTTEITTQLSLFASSIPSPWDILSSAVYRKDGENFVRDAGTYASNKLSVNNAGEYKIVFSFINPDNFVWSGTAGTGVTITDTECTVSGYEVTKYILQVPTYQNSVQPEYNPDGKTVIEYTTLISNISKTDWGYILSKAIPSINGYSFSGSSSELNLIGEMDTVGNISLNDAGKYIVKFDLRENASNFKWDGSDDAVCTVTNEIVVWKYAIFAPLLSSSSSEFTYNASLTIPFATTTAVNVLTKVYTFAAFNASGMIVVSVNGKRVDLNVINDASFDIREGRLNQAGAGTYSVTFSFASNYLNNYKWQSPTSPVGSTSYAIAGDEDYTVTVSGIKVNKATVYAPYLTMPDKSYVSYGSSGGRIAFTSEWGITNSFGWTYLSNVLTADCVGKLEDSTLTASFDFNAGNFEYSGPGTFEVVFSFKGEENYNYTFAILDTSNYYKGLTSGHPTIALDADNNTVKVAGMMVSKGQGLPLSIIIQGLNGSGGYVFGSNSEFTDLYVFRKDSTKTYYSDINCTQHINRTVVPYIIIENTQEEYLKSITSAVVGVIFKQGSVGVPTTNLSNNLPWNAGQYNVEVTITCTVKDQDGTPSAAPQFIYFNVTPKTISSDDVEWSQTGEVTYSAGEHTFVAGMKNASLPDDPFNTGSKIASPQLVVTLRDGSLPVNVNANGYDMYVTALTGDNANNFQIATVIVGNEGAKSNVKCPTALKINPKPITISTYSSEYVYGTPIELDSIVTIVYVLTTTPLAGADEIAELLTLTLGNSIYDGSAKAGTLGYDSNGYLLRYIYTEKGHNYAISWQEPNQNNDNATALRIVKATVTVQVNIEIFYGEESPIAHGFGMDFSSDFIGGNTVQNGNSIYTITGIDKVTLAAVAKQIDTGIALYSIDDTAFENIKIGDNKIVYFNASNIVADNYSFVNSTGTLKVKPLPVKVNIDDKTRVYYSTWENDYVPSFTIESTAPSTYYASKVVVIPETLSSKDFFGVAPVVKLETGAISVNMPNTAPVGGYEITLLPISSAQNYGNYVIEASGSNGTKGVYQITKAPIVVNSANIEDYYNKSYDGAEHDAITVNGDIATLRYGSGLTVEYCWSATDTDDIAAAFDSGENLSDLKVKNVCDKWLLVMYYDADGNHENNYSKHHISVTQADNSFSTVLAFASATASSAADWIYRATDVAVTIPVSVFGNDTLTITMDGNAITKAALGAYNYSTLQSGSHEFVVAVAETDNYKGLSETYTVAIAKRNVSLKANDFTVVFDGVVPAEFNGYAGVGDTDVAFWNEIKGYYDVTYAVMSGNNTVANVAGCTTPYAGVYSIEISAATKSTLSEAEIALTDNFVICVDSGEYTVTKHTLIINIPNLTKAADDISDTVISTLLSDLATLMVYSDAEGAYIVDTNPVFYKYGTISTLSDIIGLKTTAWAKDGAVIGTHAIYAVWTDSNYAGIYDIKFVQCSWKGMLEDEAVTETGVSCAGTFTVTSVRIFNVEFELVGGQSTGINNNRIYDGTEITVEAKLAGDDVNATQQDSFKAHTTVYYKLVNNEYKELFDATYVKDAGTYQARVAQGGVNLANSTFDFTISKTTITVVVEDEQVEYGEAFTGDYNVKSQDLPAVAATAEITCDCTSYNYETRPNVGATFAINATVVLPNGEKEDNYTINVTAGTLTIIAKKVNVSFDKSVLSGVYTGQGHQNALTALKSSTLKVVDPMHDEENAHYIRLVNEVVSGTNIGFNENEVVNVGKYSVTAENTSINYAIAYDTTDAIYEITKAPLTLSAVLAGSTTATIPVVYGTSLADAEALIGYRLTWNGSIYTEEGLVFGHKAISYEATTNAGTQFTVTPTCEKVFTNYEITQFNDATLTVVAKSVRLQETTYTATYNGKALSFELEWEGDDLSSQAIVSFVGVSGDIVNAGTYTATVSLGTNYKIENASINFVVSKATLNVSVKDATVEYSDEAPSFAVDVTLPKDLAEDVVNAFDGATVEYGCTYKASERPNVGTVLTVSAKYTLPEGINAGNFNIVTVNGSLTVVAKRVEVTFDNAALTGIYTGEDQSANLTSIKSLALKVDGKKLSEETDETKKRIASDVINGTDLSFEGVAKDVNANGYAVKADASRAVNYNVTFTGTGMYKITPASLTLRAVRTGSVSASMSAEYGSDYSEIEKLFSYILTWNGSEYAIDTTVTYTVANAEGKGYEKNISAAGETFTVTPVCEVENANFTITSVVPATLTITPKNVRLSVVRYYATYTGSELAPTLEWVGEDLSDIATIAFNGDDEIINAATYTAKVSVNGNYSIENPNITFIVSKSVLDVRNIRFTSKTYTGEAIVPGSDTALYTLTWDGEIVNAGTYDISVVLVDPDNYAWNEPSVSDPAVYVTTFTVEKAQNVINNFGIGNNCWTFGEYSTVENLPTFEIVYGDDSTVMYEYRLRGSNAEYTPGLPQTAGTYDVRARVPETNNCSGYTTDPILIIVDKKEIAVPTVQRITEGAGANTSYTGAMLEFSLLNYNDTLIRFDYAGERTGSGNNYTLLAKNAGTYEVKFFLRDEDNYTWAGGYRNGEKISWSIAKQKVTNPLADPERYTVTGRPLNYIPEGFDANIMSIKGNKATFGGEYDITVSLLDSDNYEWADLSGVNALGEIHFTWQIHGITTLFVIIASTVGGLGLLSAGFVLLQVLLHKRKNRLEQEAYERSDNNSGAGTGGSGDSGAAQGGNA